MHVKVRSNSQPAKIKVVGVGGAGTLAVQSLIESGSYNNIDFICIHNDSKVLSRSSAENKIDLSSLYESPLSESQKQSITQVLSDAEIIFLLCGQGKSFSTEFAPLVANIARKTGAVTMAVTTKPFAFEGKQTEQKAKQGIRELASNVDAITVLPLQNLLLHPEYRKSLRHSLHNIYEVLDSYVYTMIQLISEPRFINIDMADIRTILQEGGTTYIGQGTGESIESAFQKALDTSLVETSIDGAKRVLISISGDEGMPLSGIEEAIDKVRGRLANDAVVKFSVNMNTIDDNKIAVNIVGSGLSENAIFNSRSIGRVSWSEDKFDIPSFVRKPR